MYDEKIHYIAVIFIVTENYNRHSLALLVIKHQSSMCPNTFDNSDPIL